MMSQPGYGGEPVSTGLADVAIDGTDDVPTQQVRLGSRSKRRSEAPVGNSAALDELKHSQPQKFQKLADGLAELPELGERFLGFELVAELGRGAFGRVYLARQPELADRLVALKLAVDLDNEPQKLAQLQHTNIVPVYSVHKHGRFQSFVMPYLGATTLQHVCRGLRSTPSKPQTGLGLLDTRPPQGQTLPDLNLRPPELQSTPVVREMLARMSFSHGVLWLGARLADGLAHAHERGLLHCDLKPANVLVTDDGQPMLLDFNVAETIARGVTGRARIGGTIPYMAPEQLAAYAAGGGKIDARADLYALGMILYELLSGTLPYPNAGTTEAGLRQALDDRRQPPPPLREVNDSLSPAAAAIIARLLAHEPGDRYATARQLQEDLEHQLAHRPLKYTREPSWRERVRKWTRRHPKWAIGGMVGAATLGLVVLPVGTLAYRAREVATAEATQLWHSTQADARDARALLDTRPHDAVQRVAGAKLAREVLDRYGAAGEGEWLKQPAVTRLPGGERAELEGELGGLLVSLASAEAAEAERKQQPPAEAARLNLRAADCFPAPPAALLKQRADLFDRLGRPDDAGAARARLGQVVTIGELDQLDEAQRLVRAGDHARALPIFQKLANEDTRRYSAWAGAGACQLVLEQHTDARDSYTICIALQPKSVWARYNRGLVRHYQTDFVGALADYNAALKLHPNHAPTLVERAVTHHIRRPADNAAAERDLTAAIELGGAPPRTYFLRAAVRTKLKDAAGAEADYRAGMLVEPTDATGWNERGYARMNHHDFAGALADLDEALKLNPRMLTALRNTAHIYGEKLRQNEKAIAVHERILKEFPDHKETIGARGVYRARLGQDDLAMADAKACWQLDQTPFGSFQQACLYALIAPRKPEAKREAYRLLRQALHNGFNDLEWFDTDPDLKPLRGEAEFEEIATMARKMAAK